MLVEMVPNGIAVGSNLWWLAPAPSPIVPGINALKAEQDIQVDAGQCSYILDRQHFLPFRQILLSGRPILTSQGSRLILRDSKGRTIPPRVRSVTVERAGPVRTTVLYQGEFTRACRFSARLCFYTGTGLVRLQLTIHNPQRARHKGGCWDLGDPGSFLFENLVLRLFPDHALAEGLVWNAEPGQPLTDKPYGNLEIYQDSSGGLNWQSENHVNRHGIVPCQFRGYRLRYAKSECQGLRANPLVGVRGPGGSISVALPEFWQQFPKGISVDSESIEVGFFPTHFSDHFELQGGEQKTHTCWFNFGPANVCPAAVLGWVHEPAHARPAPGWLTQAGIAEPIVELQPADNASPLGKYLNEVIEGEKSFEHRREIIDEFGWRHYGDIFADHEAAYYDGIKPIVSHYNNQYDVVLGTLLQYFGSGAPEWRRVFDPLARHVIDIDIYHTDQDKAAYNGGLFWFTDHYKTAETATHRTYSCKNKKGQPYGGGPASAHNFTSGLLHYYFLTGDPQAKAAVITLADWVLRMEDGRLTVYGLFADGATGLASCTFALHYQGPGRGPGNSINALLDAWRVTRLPAYLEYAERLIRRCIHPHDDIEARDLLNIETRWSYTVFLSVLAKYLKLKVEEEQVDWMYAYGRASLLAYARWMLQHERPYFDQADKMEYPTEVWAAQDLRKANVLRLAAEHCDDPLQSQLSQRGQEFADRAWTDLARFDSRTVARAAAIVLTEGLRDHVFRVCGLNSMPRGEDIVLPPQEHFVPLRTQVANDLKRPLGILRILLRLCRPIIWGQAIRLIGMYPSQR